MAARQENSSKSLRILMAIGAPYVASSSPSASQDVGQKGMQDWVNLGGGPERELTHGRTINDACPQRPCVAHCTLAGQRESAPCEAIARRVKRSPPIAFAARDEYDL